MIVISSGSTNVISTAILGQSDSLFIMLHVHSQIMNYLLTFRKQNTAKLHLHIAHIMFNDLIICSKD